MGCGFGRFWRCAPWSALSGGGGFGRSRALRTTGQSLVPGLWDAVLGAVERCAPVGLVQAGDAETPPCLDAWSVNAVGELQLQVSVWQLLDFGFLFRLPECFHLERRRATPSSIRKIATNKERLPLHWCALARNCRGGKLTETLLP
jgi:hypothetical protein